MSKIIRVCWTPNVGPQTAFLASVAREVLYGGAAGPGKTEGIMAMPFYRIHNPLHRGIILRRTRPQLQEIIDRQQTLYPLIEPRVHWSSELSRWQWPSGAITQMGYMEHEQDRFKFKTFEYDMVLFDELTSFTLKQYLFMFSRNRTKDRSMPAIVRGGTNPGDVGHAWVYERFIANKEPFAVYESREKHKVEGMGELELVTTRQFIPARLADNPKMADREAYIAGLRLMGEDGDAYLEGDWRSFSGKMFKQAPRHGPPLPNTHGSMIVRSIDYGYGDPCCVGWWRVHRDGTLEGLDELYAPELTVDSIAHYVHLKERELGVRPTLSVGGHDMFKAKDTGTGVVQSIADMLVKRGVWVTMANNDRIAGWAKLRRLLAAGKLYIRDGKMPNLLRTLPYLVRDPNKPEDVKGGRQEDHAAEQTRYAIMAVPELDVSAESAGLQVAPVQQFTDADPVFQKIMRELQNPGQSVNFPELGAF
jgi:hypothetical protein